MSALPGYAALTWLTLAVLPVSAQVQAQAQAPVSRLRFGTNLVVPGKVIEFTAPFNARAHMEAARLRLGSATARGAWVGPESLTNLLKPCPLLIVSVPSGGSAIGSMRGVTERALQEGWMVLAADGPKVEVNDDSIQFGWAMLSSVLDQFTRTWPPAKRWPVACAGFSGGAKRSAAVAAAMAHEGWRIVGVYMGGCNEDRATLGLQAFQPGSQFRQVPFFLSNGTSDPIANPEQGAAVAASMRRSGFQIIRLATYPDGHRPHLEHLTEALQWFQQLSGVRTSAR
jgi:predicted esterase